LADVFTEPEFFDEVELIVSKSELNNHRNSDNPYVKYSQIYTYEDMYLLLNAFSEDENITSMLALI